MNNSRMDMKSQKTNFPFAVKLLFFIFLFFVIDFFAGSLLKYYYYTQDSGALYHTTYAIEKSSEDLLIFGTSKANHSYNPELFQNRLGYSTYNVGRDGGSIFYDYALLKSILKRYSPKIIILDVSWEFEAKQEAYDRLSMLLPYYKLHPEIRPIVEYKSDYEKFKLLSSVYPYNSMLFKILAGNAEFNKLRNKDLKGYVPLSKTWNEKIITHEIPDYMIDSNKVNFFNSFIQDCRQANVKLYVVVSPDFMKLTQVEKSNHLAREITTKNRIDFIDYSCDTVFLNNAKYFADPTHLNENGATLFTNLLIDKLEKDIKPIVMKSF